MWRMFSPYLDIFWHMASNGGSDESNSCYRFMTGGLPTTSRPSSYHILTPHSCLPLTSLHEEEEKEEGEEATETVRLTEPPVSYRR